ncbi:putative calcium-transporting ATPase 11, plasma membrane-type protein, partial [Tanacetum coccineum]
MASSTSPSSNNEDALAMLMVKKYAMVNEPYNVKKTQNQEVFLDIRKKELELEAHELAIREHEQRQRDEVLLPMVVESYLGDEFHLPSNPSNEDLSNWRKASLVRNKSRRFRHVANLDERSMNIDKLSEFQ